MQWMIDSDGGIDDCQALVLAFNTPGSNIVELSTCFGNSTEANAYTNIKEVMHICDRQDIPLHRGATRPILGDYESADYVHGESGLGHYWESHEPSPDLPSTGLVASVAILEARKKYSSLGLICIGPLTNLAIALLIDPDLKFEQLIIMGGTRHSVGNTTPLAEFNIYADPEAAAIVFERYKDIIMVPFEATTDTSINSCPDLVQQWYNTQTKSGRFIKEITEWAVSQFGDWWLCDSFAVGVALNPDITLEEEKTAVKVETAGKYGRGVTVVERYPWTICAKPSEPNTRIIMKFDFEKLMQMEVHSTKI